MKCSGYTECKSSGPGQYTCQSRSAIGQLGTFFSEGPSSNTPGWIWAVVALGLLLIGVVIYYIIQQYSKPARAPEDAYITADAYLQYGGGYGGMGSY
ncbi:calcium binding egf domain-containing protein [Cystoisospora suis]|uniref:Calcium binding egf domain-containing protein n=1 Tax=Cystoisospora suis TaxID=483139 RepID=A0A2C6LDC4_9APIC|nr:calcium binding egf domain-containing protein [Cystoisospora suis]